jgi:hypothetical protein
MEPLPPAHRDRGARGMRNKEQQVRGNNRRAATTALLPTIELDKEEAQRKAH